MLLCIRIRTRRCRPRWMPQRTGFRLRRVCAQCHGSIFTSGPLTNRSHSRAFVDQSHKELMDKKQLSYSSVYS
ncbi:hypothetical protein K466DRAFT_183011 [Polyporus arcularius HHB13444]|uniref:Uncharacterized protein n=1 Tax=Polyporus arcularius HHB13444 TaxID=1314778 RepID=A0A5C3PBM7_9APHY|nr:hypothetical protein K466DRAFT_183011 [Polyporus arcularius HHB13444]